MKVLKVQRTERVQSLNMILQKQQVSCSVSGFSSRCCLHSRSSCLELLSSCHLKLLSRCCCLFPGAAMVFPKETVRTLLFINSVGSFSIARQLRCSSNAAMMHEPTKRIGKYFSIFTGMSKQQASIRRKKTGSDTVSTHHQKIQGLQYEYVNTVKAMTFSVRTGSEFSIPSQHRFEISRP